MTRVEVKSAHKPVAFPSFLYFLGYLSTSVLAVIHEASTPDAAVQTFGANGALTFGLYIGFFLAFVSTVAYGITLHVAFKYPFTTVRNIFSAVAGCFTALVFELLIFTLPDHPFEVVIFVLLSPTILGRFMSSYWQ